jgi:FkbM family methyltransferase
VVAGKKGRSLAIADQGQAGHVTMTPIGNGEKAHRSNLLARALLAVKRVFCCLRMHQRPLGIRGALAYCSYRLFGSPKRVTAMAPGVRYPVTLRMRTTDTSIFEDVLLRGHYAQALPFDPKTIVDLGANIGMASIYYANLYPDARIVAVEAEASNFEVLSRNVASYSSILPIHAAVWNRDGNVALAAPQGANDAIDKIVFAVHDGEGISVRAITMQSLMSEAGISDIDLLKVDIEGAEKELFETALSWIHSVRCIAIELHDRFRPGCRPAVSAFTGDFLESQRGETTFYVRKS